MLAIYLAVSPSKFYGEASTDRREQTCEGQNPRSVVGRTKGGGIDAFVRLSRAGLTEFGYCIAALKDASANGPIRPRINSGGARCVFGLSWIGRDARRSDSPVVARATRRRRLGVKSPGS